MLYAGVDLGGTNIKVALVTAEGEILCEGSRPTRLPRPGREICADIAELVTELEDRAGCRGQVAALGIGCPGSVDEQGTVVYANNLEWTNFPAGQIDICIQISVVYLFIGFADYIFQKRKFNEDMKMTKQEVKDEYKNTEGDPQIKGQQRRRMREVSQRRMMQQLPEADVVITNPTHFAVALKYDLDTAPAPIVIAKGEDYLALKIKEAAKEHGIEIYENKPLARALYQSTDIGEEIPQELYQAVAEVLAFVYNIKNKQ